MTGYSGTPLIQKLGIKTACRLGLVEPPADFLDSLGFLPNTVVVGDAARGRGRFDVIVFFARTQDDLSKKLPRLKPKLDPIGGMWIGWPKKASGVVTDLGEASVRAAGLAAGLVDNKVCAINDVWSGLRFVVRVVDRPQSALR